MSRSLLLAFLSSALVGCLGSYGDQSGGGDDTGGGPGAPQGRNVFNNTVRAAMHAKCAACHQSNSNIVDPDFLGASESNYYTTIESYTSETACPDGPCMITFPDSSILLTKGVHSGGTVGWWSADEITAVRAWLDQEVMDRDLAPPDDPCIETPTLPECSGGQSNRPSTVAEALQRFAACMDYTLWVAGPGNDDNQDRYTYAVAWANSAEGLCNGCHNVASDAGYCPGGACLMLDSWGTFDSHRKSPSILKLVVPINGDGGVDLIEANRYIQKGYEGGGTDHPSFELKAECSAALQTYVRATLDRYHDYTMSCTPATEPMPPPGN